MFYVGIFWVLMYGYVHNLMLHILISTKEKWVALTMYSCGMSAIWWVLINQFMV